MLQLTIDKMILRAEGEHSEPLNRRCRIRALYKSFLIYTFTVFTGELQCFFSLDLEITWIIFLALNYLQL